jgi:hypothetical protein
MVTTGKASFKDLADSIIRDLLRIAIYQNIVTPVFGQLGVPGFTPIAHSGGIAGQLTGSKQVNPQAFAAARRYHSGGLAGLASNEVPAILQRGEEVLTTDDPRHRFNQGGSLKATANIYNEGSSPVEATRAEASFDGNDMVIDIFLNDIKKGGRSDRMLRSTYNLSRN